MLIQPPNAGEYPVLWQAATVCGARPGEWAHRVPATLTGVWVLIGTALVAAGALLFNLALVRLFGFLHAPTIAVTLALVAAAGVVAGALAAHRLGWSGARLPGIGGAGGSAAGLLALGALVFAIVAAPLNSRLANGILAYLAYVAVGATLGGAFLFRPAAAGLVAAGQFAGAGAAAAAARPLMDTVGPIDAALSAALLMALGGLVHAGAPRSAPAADEDEPSRPVLWTVLAGLCALPVLVALPLNAAAGWLRLDPARVAGEKALFVRLRASGSAEPTETLAFSSWSSRGRVDVSEPAGTPEARWVYLDGAAATLVQRYSPSGRSPDALRTDLRYLPFLFPDRVEKALIAGAAGAEELLMALRAGVREVVIAEPDATLLHMIREHAALDGRALDQPNVRVVPEDARRFLRATDERFDLIYLPLSVGAPVQPGGVTPTSHLYTIEAFAEYQEHLHDHGQLVVRLRDERELLRAFNTAFQVSTRRGADPLPALRRLVAINNDPLAGQADGEIALPLLVARRAPYREEQARAIFDLLQGSPFSPIFVPYFEDRSPLTAFAIEEIGPEMLEQRLPWDIRPATDARPFFAERGGGLTLLLLFIPLLIAAVSGGAAFLFRRPDPEAIEAERPLSAATRSFLEDDVPWRFLGFACGVSGGFALVVLPLLYRLPLLLGDVTLNIPVAGGSLLLGAAAGSLLVARVPPGRMRPVVGWAALVASLLAVAYLEVLPLAMSTVQASGAAVQMATAMLLVIPLGLCLGVPVPSAMRRLTGHGRGSWAAAVWAAGALGASVGASLGHALGFGWSFTLATVLGGLLLFGAFLAAGLRLLPFDVEALPVPSMPARDDHRFRRPADYTTPQA